jgi:tubulin monoglycylase TTLL3/8
LNEEEVRDRKICQKCPEFKKVLELAEQIKKQFPQYGIDGERNIWIVKPAGSSRGRGICLRRNLVEIVALTKQIETQYIVQKYIESSMIMKCRKFDLRQWVLVTDWNPLTVWMYAEPYVRFPASDFNLTELDNNFSHLSNNSIAKNLNDVTTAHKIEGNMWCL